MLLCHFEEILTSRLFHPISLTLLCSFLTFSRCPRYMRRSCAGLLSAPSNFGMAQAASILRELKQRRQEHVTRTSSDANVVSFLSA
jgi:hypothetical protein